MNSVHPHHSKSPNPMKNPNHIALPAESGPTSNSLTIDASNHRRRNQKRVMDNFRAAIMEIARTDPVRPLTADRKMVIEKRISEFFPQFRTPDHPPYAAMIYRAIEELNEEGGSSEDSISKFIIKEYNDLPWAHSRLLRHHLEQLCESGDIVLTSDKSYIRIAVTAPPNSSSLPCPKKKQIKRKRRREKEQSSGRTRRRKKSKIEEQNQIDEQEIEVIGGKNHQIEEHVEVIERLNEVQEQDEVIIEHNQVEKHENEMIGFELQHQENGQIELKEQEEENGQPELWPPGCDLATVEKLPKSQEHIIELSNHKKPSGLELYVEQNLFSKSTTKTTFVDIPMDSVPFEPERNLEGPRELCSLQEPPEPQQKPPISSPALLAVSQQFELEQKLDLPNSEVSLDLQELPESHPATPIVFPLSTTVSSSTPVVSHLLEQLQQPEILNQVGPQELCAQKKMPGPDLSNSENLQEGEVGAVEDVGELYCTLHHMRVEQKQLRRQSKRLSKNTPKFEQQPGLSNLEAPQDVTSTTVEVLCAAQHQQEKFHCERETFESLPERVMESVDLPKKTEQQPELSDLERFRQIKPSIIEQSSQTERMQRQLKRWSIEKSEHPVVTSMELSLSLQNKHQKQPELQNRETESSQEVPREQQEKLHGQENILSSSHLYCVSEQVGPGQHSELSSSDRVHELDIQQGEKLQLRELRPRPLKPGPEIRGQRALSKPKSDTGTIVGVVSSLNQPNETELLESVKNPPGEAELRGQKQLVRSPQSSLGIEVMEELPTQDPKPIREEQEKPRCRELRSGPRKVEKQQPERRGRGMPPKPKFDTAITEGIFLPLNRQNETELQQPMKYPTEDVELCNVRALREQKQLVHSPSSSGIELMEELSTQNQKLTQVQEKPKHRELRSRPPRVEQQQPERRGRGKPPKPKSDADTTVGTSLSLNHQSETELRQLMKNPSGEVELFYTSGLRAQNQPVQSPKRPLEIEIMEELSTQDQMLIQAPRKLQCRELRSRPPNVEKQQPECRDRGRPPKPNSDIETTMKDPSGDGEQKQSVHSLKRSSGIIVMEELSNLQKPESRKLRSYTRKVEKHQPEGRGRGRPPILKTDTDTTVGAFLSLIHQNEHEQQLDLQNPKISSGIDIVEELSKQDLYRQQAEEKPQHTKLKSRPSKIELQSESRGQGRRPKPKHNSQHHVHKEEKAKIQGRGTPPKTKLQGRGRLPKTKLGDGTSMENLLASENQQPLPKSRGRGRPRKLE